MIHHLPTRREPARPVPSALPLKAGPGARVEQTPFGRVLSAGPARKPKWKHPWFSKLHWISDSQEWVASVEPGFVNGFVPLANGIPLHDSPAITLQWHPLGWDDLTSQAIPQFFLDRGVTAAPAGLNSDSFLNDGLQNTADLVPPNGNRLLRAADLILHQPRVALTSTITLEPGILTGISNATQTLGLRDPAPGDTLKVFSGSLAPVATIDPFSGDYEEPTFDEILISTVYLLSPPNTAPDSDPDATWQPYARHSLFWNLMHVTPTLEISTADLNNAFASLTVLTSVLGGGTGSIGVNFVAAGINDLTNNALNILQSHSMAGEFYTATGGGSFSAFPTPAATESTAGDSLGIDKAANQAAARLKAQRALVSAALDPSFPYSAIPFPTGYL